MATQDFNLTSSDWVQITDGSQQASIQVIDGQAYLRDSAQKPAKGTKGHHLNTREWLGATTPQIIWMRPAGNGAHVVVTFTT